MVTNLKKIVDENLISKVTEIPRGWPWDKDDNVLNLRARTNFFKYYEKYKENLNMIKRESLLKYYGEVAYHIMKYFTSEGILSIVYAYHFKFPLQIRNLSYQPP